MPRGFEAADDYPENVPVTRVAPLYACNKRIVIDVDEDPKKYVGIGSCCDGPIRICAPYVILLSSGVRFYYKVAARRSITATAHTLPIS
jgi:hypothetical protein